MNSDTEMGLEFRYFVYETFEKGLSSSSSLLQSRASFNQEILPIFPFLTFRHFYLETKVSSSGVFVGL